MANDVSRCNISKWRLLRMTLRCMFFQSSWNYRYFQGLGWTVALLPELRLLYSPDKLPLVVKRYLKYFNTNTFLAPSVAGATLALELDQCRGNSPPIAADAYAEAIMAPVAAVGDALFWGGIRPFCSCLAVALAAYNFWWSPLVLVVLFSLSALIFRVLGAWIGYQRGAAAIEVIARSRLADVAMVLKRVTVVMLGGLCAVLVHSGD
ncbi:MAG: hypothetical protein B6I36_02695, partial [Desulfobacteraceae bacterium 4572_35.1]